MTPQDPRKVLAAFDAGRRGVTAPAPGWEASRQITAMSGYIRERYGTVAPSPGWYERGGVTAR